MRGLCKPVTHLVDRVTCKARAMPHCGYVSVYNIYHLMKIRKSKDCSRYVSWDTFMIESGIIFNIGKPTPSRPPLPYHASTCICVWRTLDTQILDLVVEY